MIEVKEINGILVATFPDQDRFNALITEPVKKTLMGYYEKPNTKMVLDLEGIRFIDSSGFSVFLNLMKAANNNYGEIKICNPTAEVKSLFEVLQLHNIFELFNTREECLKSFG